ncbi:MAG TPA: SufS family cysteine desulfurase [Leptospiraceae bacterium]|nr:SufS family cysteine desulfurase [Leptospiraceae bacterium]
MEPFDPNTIARLASQIYNEVPGASTIPKHPSELANTNHQFQDSVANHSNSVVDSDFSSKENLSLDRIKEIFSKQATSPSFNQNASEYYFLANPTKSESSSLTRSAANLKGQQSLVDNNGKGHSSLKSFVQNIQEDHHKFPGGLFTGNLENCKLFSKANSVNNRQAEIYSSRPFDVHEIRKDFPVLHQTIHGKQLAWFDNAATTQKPKSVIDAISNFYSHDNSNIHRGAHTLAARATDAYEESREKVKNFIKASSTSEIIYVRGTTEAINLVAQTFGRKFLQPGDEIILSQAEHHANIVPWQIVAKERGAVIRVIPLNDRGEVILSEYERLLGPRTKLVSITQASNSLGTILPVHEMTRTAKKYGAKVLIDGAQSVAHIPVNVQELDCDFFVFSGHKIFGPTGIGVVYGRQELLEIMPPWQGGGNMIKNVTFEETTYSEVPAKFEAGTPNIADAVGLGVALDYVSRLGLENIAKYEHSLLEYATAGLTSVKGLRLIGTAPHKVGVLSFVLQNKSTTEVGRLLDLEGIAVRAGHHCAQPSLRRYGVEATVRPSLSFYNTTGEIDRLVSAVRRIAGSF